jgi:hypothetical protein
MRNLITTIALLALLGSSGAIAQTTGSARSPAELASPTARSSMKPDTRLIGSAPVGHRQPRPSGRGVRMRTAARPQEKCG